MKNPLEIISPFKPAMSMDMSYGLKPEQRQRIKITKETPVLDQLGIDPFLGEIKERLKNGEDIDLFVLGGSHDGKETISGQNLYRMLRQLEGMVDFEYLTTTMGLDEAANRGRIKESKRGENTLEEFAIASKTMDDMLVESRAFHCQIPSDQRKALFRNIETIGMGYPYFDLGTSTLLEALKRAREKPEGFENYTVKTMFVVGTKDVQEISSKVRTAIVKAKTDEELKTAFEQAEMQVDEDVRGQKEEYEKSWGDEMALQISIDVANRHAVEIQERLREIASKIPKEVIAKNPELKIPIPENLTIEDLNNNPNLRTAVIYYRMIYLARDVFEIPEEDFTVVINRKFSHKNIRKIPYYRSLVKKFKESFLNHIAKASN